MAKLKLIVSLVFGGLVILLLCFMLFYRAQYLEVQERLKDTTKELIKTEKIIDNLHTNAVFTQDLLLVLEAADTESEAQDEIALKAIQVNKQTTKVRAQPDGTMPSDVSNVLRDRSNQVRRSAEQRTLGVSKSVKDKGVQWKD